MRRVSSPPPKLFEDLALARGDGRDLRILRPLGRADLLIIGGIDTLTIGRQEI
ncbi:MAG: hypothetical protein ACLP4V_03440 [Methylocella sp.]